MDNNQPFHYTYSAAQQQEVEHIRKKYLPPEEDKMERLRKLHNSATQAAKIRSISIGTLGALVLGTGMSLVMTDFGQILGGMAMVVGILVGLAGLAMVALAYPVYNRVLKKERARIAPEVLKLTDELLK